MPDEKGYIGAMACVVIPSFIEVYDRTKDVTPIKRWIKENLPCARGLQFFKKQGAFNIGWREKKG